MKCLFRFNIVGERNSDSKKHSDGIGHFAHCLPVAKVLKKNGHIPFLIDGDVDLHDFLNASGIAYELNADEDIAIGVTIYVSLCVGTPSINIGLTEFHGMSDTEYLEDHLFPK